jgi:hypothetical protein
MQATLRSLLACFFASTSAPFLAEQPALALAVLRRAAVSASKMGMQLHPLQHVLCACAPAAGRIRHVSFPTNPLHVCCGLQVSGQSMVDVQFYALKRVLRGMDLAPEKIEVLPAAPDSPTYTLRIINKIAFKLWSWRR